MSTAAPGTTLLMPFFRSYTTEPRWTQVEEPLDLPMRLEFSVQGGEDAWMTFSPGSKGYQYVKFSVGESIDHVLKKVHQANKEITNQCLSFLVQMFTKMQHSEYVSPWTMLFTMDRISRIGLRITIFEAF